MSTTLQAERATLLPRLFSLIAESSFSSLLEFFSSSFDYWQIGPPSVAAFLPHQGQLGTVDAVIGTLQILKAGVWAKADRLEAHRAIQEDDSMALRATIFATARDGRPYEMPIVFFVDFEEGTSKIVRIQETIDSAYAQATSARLKAAQEAANKA
ncbi:hypothetical protein JCM11251_006475 [Rhodosporidiobolus azoricus]